jgi:hypothetical protein
MTMMTSDATVNPVSCPDEIMLPFSRAAEGR